MKILSTRFYKNWSLRNNEELMIPRKMQFSLVNGMNLVVGRSHFFPETDGLIRQLPGDVNPYDVFELFVNDEIINLLVSDNCNKEGCKY